MHKKVMNQPKTKRTLCFLVLSYNGGGLLCSDSDPSGLAQAPFLSIWMQRWLRLLTAASGMSMAWDAVVIAAGIHVGTPDCIIGYQLRTDPAQNTADFSGASSRGSSLNRQEEEVGPEVMMLVAMCTSPGEAWFQPQLPLDLKFLFMRSLAGRERGSNTAFLPRVWETLGSEWVLSWSSPHFWVHLGN